MNKFKTIKEAEDFLLFKKYILLECPILEVAEEFLRQNSISYYNSTIVLNNTFKELLLIEKSSGDDYLLQIGWLANSQGVHYCYYKWGVNKDNIDFVNLLQYKNSKLHLQIEPYYIPGIQDTYFITYTNEGAFTYMINKEEEEDGEE